MYVCHVTVAQSNLRVPLHVLKERIHPRKALHVKHVPKVVHARETNWTTLCHASMALTQIQHQPRSVENALQGLNAQILRQALLSAMMGIIVYRGRANVLSALLDTGNDHLTIVNCKHDLINFSAQ